ncbi:MAG: TrkH family potassium uptake protein [Proteobacteria bacterium]|nr:TrkH family potassium uptake protein [Pseudomonadota bacterium]
MTIHSRILKTHPASLVLASFIMAITAGTFMLKLPSSTHSGHMPWVDALFTATSAVCVTGLVVVDTGSYFTLFGQGVILTLIQIGGLGVMTISVALFRLIGRSVSFRQRMIMQDLFAHTPREDIFKLLRSIVIFTFFTELIGAIFLTIQWCYEYSFQRALYLAIFHSISAFCNAGFALFSDSMIRYSDDLLLNITLCSLIVLGGIGFPVLYDLQSWVAKRNDKRVRLSVHTKTVLITTVFLVVSGALMFAFLERQELRNTQAPVQCILAPLFQSITCRTAGFNTVDIASLKDATLAMMIFLMFFGASPGSCGGGVKTTTLALLASFTFSRIRRRRRVNMFKKSIPHETVTRSTSLILVSIGIIGSVLFFLLIGCPSTDYSVENAHGVFLASLFETVSAFGTVGLSMGLTPELNHWGKFWIAFLMLIGRLGVLTFSYIIVGGVTTNGIEYSEENLMIG